MAAVNPYLTGPAGARDGSALGGGCAAAVIDPNDTAVSAEETFGNTSAWHDWHEETIIFTTKNAEQLTNKYLGLRPCYNANNKTATQIDDFKVEKVTGSTLVYDFKDGDTPMALSDITNKHYLITGADGGAGFAPAIDENGLTWQFNTGNDITLSQTNWTHNAVFADPDATGGENGIWISAGKVYIVTAKYKVIDLGDNASIDLGIGAHTGTVTQGAGKITVKSVSSESQYLTQVIDADSVSAMAGHRITLMGRASAGKLATVLVESVTVTAINKATTDVAIVKTTANPYVYDVSFVARGSKVGDYTSVYNPATTSREEAYNRSYVDPALLTTRVDADNVFANTPNGSVTGTTAVTSVEDADRGTVLQISSTADIPSTAVVSFNGFKPEVGKKYSITLDAKLISNNTNNEIWISRFYIASSAGIAVPGSKAEVSKTDANNAALNNEWQTLTWIYEHEEPTDASYEYLLLAIPHDAPKDDSAPSFVILADNFVATEYSEQADMAMQNVGSIREESGAGANYVSAGIRFKGTLSEAFRASATEIGFFAAPTAVMNGASMEEYLTNVDNVAVWGQVKADGIEEILYNEYTDAFGRKCYDYQLILTGLTTENGENDLLDTEITAVIYAVVDGNIVFSNAVSYCYNDLAD